MHWWRRGDIIEDVLYRVAYKSWTLGTTSVLQNRGLITYILSVIEILGGYDKEQHYSTQEARVCCWVTDNSQTDDAVSAVCMYKDTDFFLLCGKEKTSRICHNMLMVVKVVNS